MPDPNPTRRSVLGGLATGLTGVLAGCAAVEQPGQARSNPSGDIARIGTDEPFTELYDEVAGAVVEVLIDGPGGQQGGGSGFLTEDDRLLTNAHVVRDEPAVDVRFTDGRWSTAEVVGTDFYSDLAVLAPEETGPSDRRLSLDPAIPAIGTQVMVIGSPLGFGGSASVGVVSGVNRSLNSPTGFSIPAAIQTDAATNPGNSGGPLVDMTGDAVGVIFAGTGENIGFAISAALATEVIPVLAKGEDYEHPLLGIELMALTPTLAEANEIEEAYGVYVESVMEDSPAEEVLDGTDEHTTVNGQQVSIGGDVIRAIDGHETATTDQLGAVLALETESGQTVDLEIIRDGEPRTVELTLGARPPVERPPTFP